MIYNKITITPSKTVVEFVDDETDPFVKILTVKAVEMSDTQKSHVEAYYEGLIQAALEKKQKDDAQMVMFGADDPVPETPPELLAETFDDSATETVEEPFDWSAEPLPIAAGTADIPDFPNMVLDHVYWYIDNMYREGGEGYRGAADLVQDIKYTTGVEIPEGDLASVQEMARSIFS